MKKLFFMSLSGIWFVSCLHANAQFIAMNTNETKSYLWEFWSSVPEELDLSLYSDLEVGVFGKEIAGLDYIFEKSYVSHEKIVPGDPTERTVIRKQSVYNTIRNIEKFYRKELKHGVMDKQQVVQDYSHVLRVAIAVVNTNGTESFETELANLRKDPKSQIEVFKKVKLN